MLRSYHLAHKGMMTIARQFWNGDRVAGFARALLWIGENCHIRLPLDTTRRLFGSPTPAQGKAAPDKWNTQIHHPSTARQVLEVASGWVYSDSPQHPAFTEVVEEEGVECGEGWGGPDHVL